VSRTASLLLDEMLGSGIAVHLRDRGHDAVAVVEVAALISMSDEDILASATEQGRCVVTANVRDFATLSARWNRLGKVHAGIIHIVTAAFPQDRGYVGALVTSLDAAIVSGQVPSDGQELFLRRV
jgi:predicted nuclease of predicted toxin-antitoxin system